MSEKMNAVRDLETVIFVNIKGNLTDKCGCGVIFGIMHKRRRVVQNIGHE